VTNLFVRRSRLVFDVLLFAALMEQFFNHSSSPMFALGKTEKYNGVTRALQLMTLAIPSKNIIITCVSCTPFHQTMSLHLFLLLA